jgi:PRTRC genetic system ParB family protein
MQVTGHVQLQGAMQPPAAVVEQAIQQFESQEVAARPVVATPVAPAVPAPTTLKLKFIRPGKNPRTYFDPVEMAELTASVTEHGVAQAILVRPIGNGLYEIIAGERRYRAALAAHGEEYDMPVSIRECDDAQAEVLANIENTIRADMSAIEEAVSASKVVGRVKGDRDEAARQLSWSRGKLDSRLALMNCSDSVRTALNERKILLGHAELFASLAKDRQEKLLPAVIEKKTTVAEVKALIEQVAAKLEAAIFDKTECNGCQHNSSVQSTMFEQSITDGNCTNSTCFKAKTEAKLQETAESLKDEYPVIRIIRIGDNSTLTKLSADGATGVGAAQADECRSCSDFGAAVSGLPQGLGKVFKDQCFNTVCNSQKVAARIQSEAAAKEAEAAAVAAASAPASSPKAGEANEKSEAKPAPAAEVKTSVNEGDRIKAYREKVWRAAMKKEIAGNPDLSARYLLTLSLNSNGRNISSSALGKAFEKLAGQPKGMDIAAIATQVQALDDKGFARMTTLIAVSAMDDLDVHHLQRLAKHHELDLTKHWALDKEFLDLLTKSEIEFVAKSVGLEKAIGDGFKKLFSEKKDDLIKKLLSVENFNYSKTIPKVLKY